MVSGILGDVKTPEEVLEPKPKDGASDVLEQKPTDREPVVVEQKSKDGGDSESKDGGLAQPSDDATAPTAETAKVSVLHLHLTETKQKNFK